VLFFFLFICFPLVACLSTFVFQHFNHFFFISNVLTSKVLLIFFLFELLFPRLCPYPAWPYIYIYIYIYIYEIGAMCDPGC